jgi:hypothetical protein
MERSSKIIIAATKIILIRECALFSNMKTYYQFIAKKNESFEARCWRDKSKDRIALIAFLKSGNERGLQTK